MSNLKVNKNSVSLLSLSPQQFETIIRSLLKTAKAGTPLEADNAMNIVSEIIQELSLTFTPTSENLLERVMWAAKSIFPEFQELLQASSEMHLADFLSEKIA